MASLDRDDDFDPETHKRYRCRPFSLADGTATLYLPIDWELRKERFSSAEFDIPWVPGTTLFIKAMSYEDPQAIARNELADLLGGQDLPPAEPEEYRADGSVAWERQTVRLTGTAGRPEDPRDKPRDALWLRRRIGLPPPDHIRTLELQLHIPLQDAKHARAVETVHFIDEMLAQAVFAAQPTVADRVAPNDELRQDWLWETI